MPYKRWTAKEVAKYKLWKIGDGQPSEVDLSPFPDGKDVVMMWRADTYSKTNPWVTIYDGNGNEVGLLKIDVKDYETFHLYSC